MEKKAEKVNEMKFFDFKLEPGLQEIKNQHQISKHLNLITIITYFTDKTQFMEQTALSILNQTFVHFEWIIIVNNKITTKQLEVLQNIKKKDERIKIIETKYLNKYAARKEIVEYANSDIILFLDEGNLIDKTMLECGYFTLLTNPEAVGAYSDEVYFGYKRKLYNKKTTIDKLMEKNIIAESYFVKKSNFLEVKKYTKLGENIDADWYMWLYFISKEYKIIKMNFYGYWHRILPGEDISKLDKDCIEDEKDINIKEILNSLNKKNNILQFEDGDIVDYSDKPQIFELSNKNSTKKSESKKVLFIVPWSLIGGSEIFNLNLLKGLKNKGYEVSIVSTKKCGYVLRQDMEKYAKEYFDVTSFLKRKEWASFIHYIIKTRNIDCVFLTNSFYGYCALPWLKYHFKNIPFLDYVHTEKWTLRNGGYPKDSNAVADYLDRTYTCTKYLKNMMYTVMNRTIKNVKEMYIGTDTDYYNPKIEYKGEEELKEQLKGKKVILLPCRVTYDKRPIFAVKLIERIIKKRQDVILLIVGDGDALEETKLYIEEKKLDSFVKCEGMHKDIRRYYKCADVTLVCSLREGLSLTSYESLSMQTPVITSDVGGQKELINEKCGRLIKAYQNPIDAKNFNYTEEELKEYEKAIYDIIDNNEKDTMKKYCRKRVINGFSIKKMIENMDKEFINVIKNGSKVDKEKLKNIELAERYLLVHNILESKEERKKI